MSHTDRLDTPTFTLDTEGRLANINRQAELLFYPGCIEAIEQMSWLTPPSFFGELPSELGADDDLKVIVRRGCTGIAAPELRANLLAQVHRVLRKKSDDPVSTTGFVLTARIHSCEHLAPPFLYMSKFSDDKAMVEIRNAWLPTVGLLRAIKSFHEKKPEGGSLQNLLNLIRMVQFKKCWENANPSNEALLKAIGLSGSANLVTRANALLEIDGSAFANFYSTIMEINKDKLPDFPPRDFRMPFRE